MYRKILLPIDITEPEMTDRAISVAQGLAKAFDSEMRVVNVQSLLPISFLDYVPENFNVQVRRGLEKEIAAVAAKIDCAPERVSTTLLFGSGLSKGLGRGRGMGRRSHRAVLASAGHGPFSHRLQRNDHRQSRAMLGAGGARHRRRKAPESFGSAGSDSPLATAATPRAM